MIGAGDRRRCDTRVNARFQRFISVLFSVLFPLYFRFNPFLFPFYFPLYFTSISVLFSTLISLYFRFFRFVFRFIFSFIPTSFRFYLPFYFQFYLPLYFRFIPGFSTVLFPPYPPSELSLFSALFSLYPRFFSGFIYRLISTRISACFPHIFRSATASLQFYSISNIVTVSFLSGAGHGGQNFEKVQICLPEAHV